MQSKGARQVIDKGVDGPRHMAENKLEVQEKGILRTRRRCNTCSGCNKNRNARKRESMCKTKVQETVHKKMQGKAQD